GSRFHPLGGRPQIARRSRPRPELIGACVVSSYWPGVGSRLTSGRPDRVSVPEPWTVRVGKASVPPGRKGCGGAKKRAAEAVPTVTKSAPPVVGVSVWEIINAQPEHPSIALKSPLPPGTVTLETVSGVTLVSVNSSVKPLRVNWDPAAIGAAEALPA